MNFNVQLRDDKLFVFGVNCPRERPPGHISALFFLIVFVVVVKVRMSCDARTGMTGVAPADPGGDKPLSLLTYRAGSIKRTPYWNDAEIGVWQ